MGLFKLDIGTVYDATGRHGFWPRVLLSIVGFSGDFVPVSVGLIWDNLLSFRTIWNYFSFVFMYGFLCGFLGWQVMQGNFRGSASLRLF